VGRAGSDAPERRELLGAGQLAALRLDLAHALGEAPGHVVERDGEGLQLGGPLFADSRLEVAARDVAHARLELGERTQDLHLEQSDAQHERHDADAEREHGDLAPVGGGGPRAAPCDDAQEQPWARGLRPERAQRAIERDPLAVLVARAFARVERRRWAVLRCREPERRELLDLAAGSATPELDRGDAVRADARAQQLLDVAALGGRGGALGEQRTDQQREPTCVLAQPLELERLVTPAREPLARERERDDGEHDHERERGGELHAQRPSTWRCHGRIVRPRARTPRIVAGVEAGAHAEHARAFERRQRSNSEALAASTAA